jgi:hypothetical protein
MHSEIQRFLHVYGLKKNSVKVMGIFLRLPAKQNKKDTKIIVHFLPEPEATNHLFHLYIVYATL